MKRFATFWSSQFENKTPQPHFINERCFGEDLARWLRDRLDPTLKPGKSIQEDYGWGFWVDVLTDPYWVYVSVMDDSIGRDRAEWLMGVAYDSGLNLIRRLFHKPNAENLLMLCRALDVALQGTDAVSEIQWWQEEPQTGTPMAHPE